MIVIFFFFTSILFAAHVCATTTPVYIGVMYSGSGPLESVGARTLLNMRMWQDLNPELSPGLVPVLVMCDVASDPDRAVACFYELTQQHNISVMIAPENDLPSVVAPLTDAAQILLIASVSGLQNLFVCDDQLLSPCTKTYGPRYRSLLGNGITANQAGVGIMSLLKYFGAATVAFVRGPDVFNSAICQGVLGEAQDVRLDVLLDYVLPSAPFGNITAASSHEVVRNQLKRLDPDVVLWCNAPFCQEASDAFFDESFYPRGLIMSQCAESEYAQSHEGLERFRYVMGGSVWDSRSLGLDFSDDASLPYCNNFPPIQGRGSSSPPISSSERFAKAFLDSTGVRQQQATQTDAGIYAGMYIAQAAIVIAQSLASADILRAVSSLNIPSFKGRLQVDSNRMVNWGGSLFTQVSDTGKNQIIYPSSSVMANTIYPAPSFEERRYKHVPLENLCEQLVVVLAFLLSAYVVWYVARPIIRHRDTESIRAINCPLSVTSLVGVVLSNLSVLTWTVHNTQAQCDVRLWAWACGFALIISPLIGGFARIHFIVRNSQILPRSKNILRFPAVQLTVQMAICTAILAAWTARAPFVLSPLVVDSLRPSTNINECLTSGWMPYGLLFLSCFLGALGFLAWMTLSIRLTVRHPRFHRARAVINASFTWIVLVGVLVMFQTASGPNVPATWMFTVRSLLLLATNLWYVAIMYWVPIASAQTSTLSKRISPMTNQSFKSRLSKVQVQAQAQPPVVAVELVRVPLPIEQNFVRIEKKQTSSEGRLD